MWTGKILFMSLLLLLFCSGPAFSQGLSSQNQEKIRLLVQQEILLNQALKHIDDLKEQKANLELELNQTKEKDAQRYNELLTKLAELESELEKWKQTCADLLKSIDSFKSSITAEYWKGIGTGAAIGAGALGLAWIIVEIIKATKK